MEYWVGYLLFWSDISEDVAIEGAKYILIEGPDETFSVREGMAKAFQLQRIIISVWNNDRFAFRINNKSRFRKLKVPDRVAQQ